MTEKTWPWFGRDFRGSTVFAFYLRDGDPGSQRASPGPERFRKADDPKHLSPGATGAAVPLRARKEGVHRCSTEKKCAGAKSGGKMQRVPTE